ncbi:MAG: hypothetical protein Q9183_006019 [Haloplaca sp. 2 TL-2023]
MTDVMLCDGKRINITPSLNAALKTKREGRKLQDELLWADAVSINQADETEVGEQIPLMRRIYTDATGVFVHLGLDGRQLSRGLDLVLRAATVHQHSTSPAEYGAADIDEIRWPSPEHPCWEEFYILLSSPWISRTWILQEVVLAKHTSLGVGRYMLEWEVFDRSVHVLKEHGLVPSESMGSPLGLLNFVSHRKIKHISQSPDDTSLFHLLKATRQFQVTDPRDKVVALLGLLGDLHPELKALCDRRLSTAQVYHRTAVYLLRTPALPYVLAHAGLQQVGRFEMPSWVPDWYADNGHVNKNALYESTRAYMAGGRGTFCAIGAVPDHPLYPRQLFCPGFCHHRIIEMSDAANDPMHIAWYESARMCLEGSKSLVYQKIEEAYARTLLVDNLPDINSILPRSGMANIGDVMTTHRAAIAILKSMSNEEEASDNIMMGTTTAEVETCITQMLTTIRNRRFAITDTGYMCLAPSRAETGDLVAIFLGCPTPSTIRPESEPETLEDGVQKVCAKLIGDTYMHGMMDRETMMEATRTGRMLSMILLS